MATHPFAFEREFSDPNPAGDPAADALAEALAAAEAKGFAAGEAAALARLRHEQGSRIEDLLAGLLAQADTAEKLAEERTGALEREAEALAIAAAELLAGRMVDAAPAGAIGAALTTLLGELRRGLPLALWVHPDLVAAVEAIAAECQRSDRRRRPVTVQGDAALAVGDARLAWDEGQALVDAAARRAALERLLDRKAAPTTA